MKRMEDAKGLVPIKMAIAAETILDGDEHVPPEVQAYLQRIIDAPHYLPVADPWVLVKWELDSYRNGRFRTAARIPLSIYLAVCAKNLRFWWSDVLGKHSEVGCHALEFDEAELSFDDEDAHFDEDDCSREWRESYGLECEPDKALVDAVAARLKALGPFLPETKINLAEEIGELSRKQKKKQKK